MSVAALETFLRPVYDLLEENDVNEICINEPLQCWVEKRGEHIRKDLPEYNFNHLLSMGRLIAQSTNQSISSETPILSATLPNGFRVQIVFPPAVEQGTVAMSIRKPSVLNMGLDDYEKIGAFQEVSFGKVRNPMENELVELHEKKDIKNFLKASVKARKNIIISGGTSTGKTTFANALYKEIPHHERLITIEDAREIKLEQPNKLHLVASKGGQGLAKVNTQDLIEACLRLAPSRLIVGELRGAEAFGYLRAVNTGHPGSIATLHADNPRLAIEQMCLMVLQAGVSMTRQEIKNYVKQVVEVVVQLKRGAGGRRYVSEILYEPNEE
jgi:type IV secretion system protein VirB11